MKTGGGGLREGDIYCPHPPVRGGWGHPEPKVEKERRAKRGGKVKNLSGTKCLKIKTKKVATA